MASKNNAPALTFEAWQGLVQGGRYNDAASAKKGIAKAKWPEKTKNQARAYIDEYFANPKAAAAKKTAAPAPTPKAAPKIVAQAKGEVSAPKKTVADLHKANEPTHAPQGAPALTPQVRISPLEEAIIHARVFGELAEQASRVVANVKDDTVSKRLSPIIEAYGDCLDFINEEHNKTMTRLREAVLDAEKAKANAEEAEAAAQAAAAKSAQAKAQSVIATEKAREAVEAAPRITPAPAPVAPGHQPGEAFDPAKLPPEEKKTWESFPDVTPRPRFLETAAGPAPAETVAEAE